MCRSAMAARPSPTRSARATFRPCCELKDGETQVLAGLIQDSDQRTRRTFPAWVICRSWADCSARRGRRATRARSCCRSRLTSSARSRGPTSESMEFWYGTETQTRAAPFSSAPTSSATGGAAACRHGSWRCFLSPLDGGSELTGSVATLARAASPHAIEAAAATRWRREARPAARRSGCACARLLGYHPMRLRKSPSRVRTPPRWVMKSTWRCGSLPARRLEGCVPRCASTRRHCNS